MATKIMSLSWNFDDLFAGLDRYSALVVESFGKSARLVAMDGLGKMVAAAPVQTGFLRGSGSAHVNGYFQGGGAEAGAGNPGDPNRQSLPVPQNETVIVWGFNTFYAAQVHENPNAGVRGGGPKYVEKVISMNQKKWMQFFANNLKRDGEAGR